MANGDGGERESWITKYGVPTLILSVAAFVVQAQQQAFDAWQRNVQAGYLFYSDGRTSLRESDDAAREIALLKTIGNAFPDIYCKVRQDIYDRAKDMEAPRSAPIAEGAEGLAASSKSPFLQSDQDWLIGRVRMLDRPSEPLLPTNVLGVFSSWRDAMRSAEDKKENPRNVPTCETLVDPVAKVEEASPATPTEQPVAAAPAPTPAPAPAPATGAPAAPTRTADAKIPQLPNLRSGGESLKAAQVKSLTSTMRVFVQVVDDGPRKTEDFDAIRNDLAPLGYRVMRGVERVPATSFDKQGYGEVRYYGDAERETAEQLRKYLDEKYAADNIKFKLTPIGSRYRDASRNNLEIWLPNPKRTS